MLGGLDAEIAAEPTDSARGRRSLLKDLDGNTGDLVTPLTENPKLRKTTIKPIDLAM